MYSSPNVDPGLMRFVFQQLAEVCERHNCWPGDIASGNRRLPSVVAARRELAAILRTRVSVQVGYTHFNSRDGLGMRRQAVRYTFTVLPPDSPPPDGSHQMGYPMIAGIIGGDHSTYLLALRRDGGNGTAPAAPVARSTSETSGTTTEHRSFNSEPVNAI